MVVKSGVRWNFGALAVAEGTSQTGLPQSSIGRFDVISAERFS